MAHPSQTTEGEIEPPLYGQMYFLNPNEAVEERLTHSLNHGISRDLMNILEEILRDTNDYAKGYGKVCEVDEDTNQLAASL